MHQWNELPGCSFLRKDVLSGALVFPPMLGRYSLPALDIAGDIAPSKVWVREKDKLTFSTSGWSSCSPTMGTVRIVGRSIVLQRCLASFIDSAASSSIVSITYGLILRDLGLFIILNVCSVDRYLAADGADLHNCLFVINRGDLPSMSFPHSTHDEDLLALKWVSSHFVHTCYCTISSLPTHSRVLQMLTSKDTNVPGLFHKEAISLMEVSIPEEDCLFVDELESTTLSFVGSRSNLHYIIKWDCVPLRVQSCDFVPLVSSILLLRDLRRLHLLDLALLINDPDEIHSCPSVRVHLQNHSEAILPKED